MPSRKHKNTQNDTESDTATNSLETPAVQVTGRETRAGRKRAASTDQPISNLTTPTPTKSTKKKAKITLIDENSTPAKSRELPGRANRSQRELPDNGFIPRAPRRTSEQVQADKEQLEVEIQAQQQQLLDSQRRLAEMEIDEEEEDMVEVEERVDRFEIASTDSESEKDNVDEAELEHDETDDHPGNKQTTKSRKASSKSGRGKKGEMKAAVETLKGLVREDRGTSSAKGKGKKTTATQKQQVNTGGLLSDWKERGSKEVVGSRKTQAVEESTSDGGLNDEDAAAVKPPFAKTPVKRSNNLVALKNSKDTTAKTPEKTPTATAPTPASISNKTPKSSKARVKKTSQLAITTKVTTDTPAKAEPVPMPDIATGWRTKGTAAFYGLLLCSERPFHDFRKTNDRFRDIVQSTVPVLYNSQYQVVKGDDLYEKAYDRVNEKRRDIGDTAIEIVERFFEAPEYSDDASARRSYALSALKVGGPLLYSEPRPPHKSAKGLFLSPFIVDVVKKYINVYTRSPLSHGEPIGLLALAAAALERAFRRYTDNGIPTTPPSFSEGFVGESVVGYMVSAKQMSPNRWKELRKRCGVEEKKEEPIKEEEDPLDISSHRHILYDLSSPPPEETS
ncbi:hypothetical protein V5O48_016434 [Marasmius crinis-equi]|uniref:Uncharacterized protein n=1 Tax=Marasmius crinis-equi TaxID=585013 RepID=A0ABR3ES05_9AGAR